MDGIMQILLLNFLFLLFFLLFIPILIDQTSLNTTWKKWIKIVSYSFAIISCITFPLEVSHGLIFDLRYVAAIIGGIYGGVPTAIVLWLVNISYRSIYGGDGVQVTLVIATLHMLFFTFVYPRWKLLSHNDTILAGIAIASISSIITTSFVSSLYLNSIPWFIGISLFLVQLTAVAIIIYFQELMKEMLFMKREMIHGEKIEMVNHLASSISHEVRNPLTVVKGFLQLMKDSNLSEEKRNEFLSISINEIDRANKIIGDYLAFAKPSQEQQTYLNIKEELSVIVEVIIPLANMNSVSVEIEEIDSDLWVLGEKQLLQQCLLNITKNCVEAMPSGGTLSITAKKEKNKLHLTISDTGIGMTEEQLKRIGEPYFSTKGENGTGLGMMTSFQIIHSMNGTIKIASELNKGSTFTIRIPLVHKKNVNNKKAKEYSMK